MSFKHFHLICLHFISSLSVGTCCYCFLFQGHLKAKCGLFASLNMYDSWVPLHLNGFWALGFLHFLMIPSCQVASGGRQFIQTSYIVQFSLFIKLLWRDSNSHVLLVQLLILKLEQAWLCILGRLLGQIVELPHKKAFRHAYVFLSAKNWLFLCKSAQEWMDVACKIHASNW